MAGPVPQVRPRGPRRPRRRASRRPGAVRRRSGPAGLLHARGHRGPGTGRRRAEGGLRRGTADPGGVQRPDGPGVRGAHLRRTGRADRGPAARSDAGLAAACLPAAAGHQLDGDRVDGAGRGGVLHRRAHRHPGRHLRSHRPAADEAVRAARRRAGDQRARARLHGHHLLDGHHRRGHRGPRGLRLARRPRASTLNESVRGRLQVEYGPSDGQAGPGGRAAPPGAAPPGAAGVWGASLSPGQPRGAVDPAWLAATADRERAAGVLRAGFAEGRLTQDELDDRLARVYASRTYGQLWALTADLPAGPMPFQHPAGPPAPVEPGQPSAWRSAAALVVTALVIFALAALVTAVITAHAQQVIYTPPFQQPHLLPFIRTGP